MDWARILAYVTGTVDQELLARNEYLAAENRLLKAQLKGRLKLSDGAFRAAISAACAAISAMSSSRVGPAGESAFIESLNRSPIPMSSKTYRLDFAKKPAQPGQEQNISDYHGSNQHPAPSKVGLR